jgi:hypothetical protein
VLLVLGLVLLLSRAGRYIDPITCLQEARMRKTLIIIPLALLAFVAVVGVDTIVSALHLGRNESKSPLVARDAAQGVQAVASLPATTVRQVRGEKAALGGEITRWLEPTRFLQLHARIKPQPGESRWEQIAWHTDLWEARKQAAAEGKMLVVWWGLGHPLSGYA